MAEQSLKFRGGVRYTPDDKKWHIIVEINGAQYLDEEGYDTEEEAMTVYRAAREDIINATGVPSGPDMDFNNPIKCNYCSDVFTTFKAYDAHLPCKS